MSRFAAASMTSRSDFAAFDPQQTVVRRRLVLGRNAEPFVIGIEVRIERRAHGETLQRLTQILEEIVHARVIAFGRCRWAPRPCGALARRRGRCCRPRIGSSTTVGSASRDRLVAGFRIHVVVRREFQNRLAGASLALFGVFDDLAARRRRRSTAATSRIRRPTGPWPVPRPSSFASARPAFRR